MKKLLIATHNQGKIKEIKSFLSPYVESIITLKDLNDVDEVIEDCDTYEGNAIKKAQYFYDKYHIPTLADDSGLELDAIPTYPGIYSARIADNDELRNRLIIEKLTNHTNRHAKMIAVLAIISTKTHTFRGEIEGVITHSMTGSHGFGYDKIFYVEALNKTFGEVEQSIKSTISHRGKALQSLISHIKENSHGTY
jgi:XTP/dITP diphosphohydrolase